MKYIVDLSDKKYYGPIVGELSEGTASRPLSEFISHTKGKTSFKTGLMPVNGSGVLSIQSALEHEQIIYQIKPGIETVKWGATENDPKAQLYSLAMPWRIIIADFYQGQFTGVRHFWSPNAIRIWEQPLYAVPLPNTNTIGYSNTSVGWICLYRNDDTRKMNMAEKIEYFLGRVNGVAEPYNDDNMRDTDGARQYLRINPDSPFSQRSVWVIKTEREGLDWVLNADLMMKLHVVHDATVYTPQTRALSVGHAQKYQSEGPVYTLNRAANESYSAYYKDYYYTKYFQLDPKDYDDLAINRFFSPHLTNSDQSQEVSLKTILIKINELSARVRMKDYNRPTLIGKTQEKCDNCATWSRADKFKNVIFDTYVTDNNGINTRMARWCPECANDENVIVFKNMIVHRLLVTTCAQPPNTMIWSNESVQCRLCMASFHRENSDDYLVHTFKEDGRFTQTGCWSCLNLGELLDIETVAVRDYHSGRLYSRKYMYPHLISQLAINAETGETELVEMRVWTTTGGAPCKCGLFNRMCIRRDDDGKGMCSSCIDPITNEYRSLINTKEKPKAVTTDQLLAT